MMRNKFLLYKPPSQWCLLCSLSWLIHFASVYLGDTEPLEDSLFSHIILFTALAWIGPTHKFWPALLRWNLLPQFSALMHEFYVPAFQGQQRVTALMPIVQFSNQNTYTLLNGLIYTHVVICLSLAPVFLFFWHAAFVQVGNWLTMLLNHSATASLN